MREYVKRQVEGAIYNLKVFDKETFKVITFDLKDEEEKVTISISSRKKLTSIRVMGWHKIDKKLIFDTIPFEYRNDLDVGWSILGGVKFLSNLGYLNVHLAEIDAIEHFIQYYHNGDLIKCSIDKREGEETYRLVIVEDLEF